MNRSHIFPLLPILLFLDTHTHRKFFFKNLQKNNTVDCYTFKIDTKRKHDEENNLLWTKI